MMQLTLNAAAFTTLFLSGCSPSQDSDADHCTTEYEKFLTRFNKEYSDERRTIFCAKLQFVEAHNQAAADAQDTDPFGFVRAINKFSDWSPAELSGLSNGVVGNASSKIQWFEPPENVTAAAAIDWRPRMPAVQDQGECYSCWAFAAVAIVDFWVGGKQSEQQLLDCHNDAGDCEGGHPADALGWLESHGGSFAAKDLPYTGTASGYCPKLHSTAQVSNIQWLNGAKQIVAALQQQVVVVAVELGVEDDLSSYGGGIWHQKCGSDADVGHAMVAVGYGTKKNKHHKKDYWIIRNSWGADWGKNKDGHMLFERGVDLCKIESWMVVTADATAVPAPAQIEVTKPALV